MKIQIAKQDLVGTLQQVNPSLASAGSSDDISVHYLFRAVEDGDGHKAEVLTCHGAMFSTAPLIGAVVDVPDGSPAMFTVEGKRLKQWLQTASDAALTMEYDASESEVLMTAPIGKMRFGSVDPSKFRLWDKLVKDAEVKSTVKAVKLKDAFDYTHRFCSEDRQRPDLIVFESRDGALMATDGTAAAKVTVPDLGDEVFRVLGKEDTPKFVAFLGTAAEDDDVTVLVHPRALILKKADGALMGERKPDKGFPKDFSGRTRPTAGCGSSRMATRPSSRWRRWAARWSRPPSRAWSTAGLTTPPTSPTRGCWCRTSSCRRCSPSTRRRPSRSGSIGGRTAATCATSTRPMASST
jgi:hypothetical protein